MSVIAVCSVGSAVWMRAYLLHLLYVFKLLLLLIHLVIEIEKEEGEPAFNVGDPAHGTVRPVDPVLQLFQPYCDLGALVVGLLDGLHVLLVLLFHVANQRGGW